jgi:hypothetical protein
MAYLPRPVVNIRCTCMAKGLKYTEHKPFSRHYLGVTRTTMSSAVHTLTQVKARISIMAVIVNSWCCSYRFISLLMYSWIEYHIYGHLSFLSRDLLTPPAASVHCLYSDFTAYKWHSEHQRESRGTLEFCPCMPFIFEWWSCEESKF